jgi:hypothetical protein
MPHNSAFTAQTSPPIQIEGAHAVELGVYSVADIAPDSNRGLDLAKSCGLALIYPAINFRLRIAPEETRATS